MVVPSPPSTSTVWPRIIDAAGEIRKAATSAASSAVSGRPAGVDGAPPVELGIDRPDA
jgi:hypothetical protein